MDNKINSVFLYYNETESSLEILHEKSNRVDDKLISHHESNDFDMLKLVCNVAITSFNMGKISNGKGNIHVSPGVDYLYLQDGIFKT